jgi:hypothetical protein
LVRWIDPKWWARKLRKIWEQYGEHCAILLGHVRKGVSAYVSSQGLRAFIERQQMAAAWLKDMEAYNAEDNITISLADAVKTSIANPENRRYELVVRARGFSDVADDLGYVGLFFTWTAPSRFPPPGRPSRPRKPTRQTAPPKTPNMTVHHPAIPSAISASCGNAAAHHWHVTFPKLATAPPLRTPENISVSEWLNPTTTGHRTGTY